jgi:hypothetical protein
VKEGYGIETTRNEICDQFEHCDTVVFSARAFAIHSPLEAVLLDGISYGTGFTGL